MSRLTILATVFFLAACTVSPPAQAQSGPRDIEIWADRLLGELRVLSQSRRTMKDGAPVKDGEALKDGESELLLTQAGGALALAGRAEDALAVLPEMLDEPQEVTALLFIADAQSTRDDVDGAFQTANLLPNKRLVQRARSLIAIRQAQRGDLEDSVQLLGRVTDPVQRVSAKRQIIAEMLRARRYKDALTLYESVQGSEDRERIRKLMEHERERVGPGDANYTEKSVANARRQRSLFGRFSDQDAELVRLECHARMAALENDQESFKQAIDRAVGLIQDRDVGDRCSKLLILGTICAESGFNRRSRELFTNALDTLFAEGKPELSDGHFKVYFALQVGEYVEAIANVMSDSQLLNVNDKMIVIDAQRELLTGFGRGLGAAGKMNVAEAIYDRLRQTILRISFSTGVLDGVASRSNRTSRSPLAVVADTEEQEPSLTIIDRIIADKPPLEYKLTGNQRPERGYLGPYNVLERCVPDEVGEIWSEKDELPELTLEEFLEVRAEIVTALWGHGSVYGFPSTEGEHDFFVYEDKFFDRTQKIEIRASDALAEILPPAVVDVQKVLAKHPLWRVMVLGHGENAEQEYFVVYPDAIRILQSENSDSMKDAIEANAKLRAGKN